MAIKDPEEIRQFRDRLLLSMQDANITASELSRLSGVGKSDISNYCNGKYKAKQDKIERLAEALNVNPWWLMSGYEDETVEPAEFLKNEQENYIPSTNEAKIISRGVDGLDSDDRQKALNVLKIMFQQHGDIFADHVKEYYETKDGPKDDLY